VAFCISLGTVLEEDFRTVCYKFFFTSPAGTVAKYCDEYCLSVCVCLSVCPRGYLQNHTCDLYQIFVHVAYVRGSVLFRHVDDRPHRVSLGRGFLPPLTMHLSPEPHARSFAKFFVHVAWIRGSVLLLHIYDRPHCLSPGRGFLPHWKCIIARKR